MKKDALWHLLFLFFNFLFSFVNATNEGTERIETAKMGEIQEIGNAIRKINLLQFNLAIQCQIHREYKLAGEKLKQMLLDDHSSDHSRLIHFPLPWLMGLNLAIGADEGLERQRILVNALDILVEEGDRLLAMDDLRRYVGLQGHLRRLTPAYLMRHYEANAPGNNLLILRLEFWTSFAKTALQNGPDEFLHVFSPSLLTTLTNKLAQLKNAQIIIPEIGKTNLEEFGRNELKKWTKIGMDELREAKRGQMNLKEIWRRTRRLKAIRQAKIHFETMYLRVEMLLELFSLAMALCTRLSEQQAQQQKDPVLGFKEIVERFYKRAKKSYKMAEQGRELANLVAVNLLPNEAKEMGETSKKKAEKEKIVNKMEENTKRGEKDGNEGEELDGEIANLIKLNLGKNIEEEEEMGDCIDLDGDEEIWTEEEENWPKSLTKTNEKGKEKGRKPPKITKDYHKVLKVMEGNLIRGINLEKAIAENEAEIFEIVESKLERRIKKLEKETIGEIAELIGIVNFVEDRKYGHGKMEEKILKEVQEKMASSSLN